MARVAVVGAGIAGLAAALYATSAGHHVVVLEKSDRIGGRASSNMVDGVPVGYGLHLLLKHGPLYQLVKKVSKLPMVLASPRLDRLHHPSIGPLRPRKNVRQAAIHLRALRSKDQTSPIVQATALLAGSGISCTSERFEALVKQKLAVVGEGWSGITGRMASALDEVGVVIEPNCQVTGIQTGIITMANKPKIECDVIIIACGHRDATRLLEAWEEEVSLSRLETLYASTIDVTLSSKPLQELHGLVDPSEGSYVLDLTNIQRRWRSSGAYLSALSVAKDNESDEQRLERLKAFLDSHATGWKHHIVQQREQASIRVQTIGKKPQFDALSQHGILLAGEWVASPHLLADGAALTGKLAGQHIANAMR